jgi:hypothetical protein
LEETVDLSRDTNIWTFWKGIRDQGKYAKLEDDQKKERERIRKQSQQLKNSEAIQVAEG